MSNSVPAPRDAVGSRPVGSRRRARRLVATTFAATLAVTGCSLPTSGEAEPALQPSEAPIGAATPDPAREALVGEVERLHDTVSAARTMLADGLDQDLLDDVRTVAASARELLVADTASDASPDVAQDLRPLFPAESLGREDSSDASDQLTNTLTAAREVGGDLGNAVVDLLRDPVAGDLGAWQRDAAGVLVSITMTTEEADDLTGLEAAVSELPGLATQAVAWVELVAAADTTDEAHTFLERAVASLDVVIVGLDVLELDDPRGTGDGPTPEDGEGA